MSVKSKIENFLYYYKWIALVVAIFLVFIIISAVQMMSKTEADAVFLHVGITATPSPDVALINESTGKMMTSDPNGDGKKKISFVEITVIPDDTNRTLHLDSAERYRNEVFSGDALIYLLDYEYFSELKDASLIAPLESALGSVPEAAFDEYGILLGKLDAYSLPGFSYLPSDTVICLRVPQTLGISAEESAERHENAKSIFRDIVSYRAPEDVSAETKTKE